MSDPLDRLRKVRLGARERRILLDAPAAETVAYTMDEALERRERDQERLSSLIAEPGSRGSRTSIERLTKRVSQPVDPGKLIHVDRMLVLEGKTRADRVATLRAAKRLERHGLIERYATPADHPAEHAWRARARVQMTAVCRTTLGDLFVERHQSELLDGSPIQSGRSRSLSALLTRLLPTRQDLP